MPTVHKNLLLIGPAPQNIGGVSMHLRRLIALLRDDYNITFVDEGRQRFSGVYNLRSLNLWHYYRMLWKADVVHIHSGVNILRWFHVINCLLLHKKVVVSIHHDPRIESHQGITRYLLRHCNHAILVNQEGFEAMKQHGKCHYHMIPAFLPPVVNDEPELPFGMKEWIANFRQTHADAVVCCSNAGNLAFNNGQDVYGLDLCLQAINSLCQAGHHNVALVFVVAASTSRPQALAEYKQFISAHQLDSNVLIWESSLSFVRLIQNCDLVLRATNTDGDALSLREALYCGKRVIASDVVQRPQGTALFKNRDARDLADKILNVGLAAGTAADEATVNYRQLYEDIYNC